MPWIRGIAAVVVLAWLAAPALAKTDVRLGLNIGPPPVVVEALPPAPAGVVWAPGYWVWDGDHHVWHKGHYVKARPGFVWEPPRWEERHGRWFFVPGRWVRA